MYFCGDSTNTDFAISRPSKMMKRILRATGPARPGGETMMKVWEKELLIPANTEQLKYRYGIKEKIGSEIVWEREPSRFCNMKDLRVYKNGQFDHYQDALGVEQKKTVYFKFNRSTYKKMDAVFVNDLVYSKINEHIGLGPYPYYEEINSLSDKGYKAILNLQSAEDMERLGYHPAAYEEICNLVGIAYRTSPIQSQERLSPSECLLAVNVLNTLIENFKSVYIHCSEGVTRSPVVVILYLHLSKKYDLWKALKMVKRKRIRCNANKETIQELIKEINDIETANDS